MGTCGQELVVCRICTETVCNVPAPLRPHKIQNGFLEIPTRVVPAYHTPCATISPVLGKIRRASLQSYRPPTTYVDKNCTRWATRERIASYASLSLRLTKRALLLRLGLNRRLPRQWYPLHWSVTTRERAIPM